MAQADAACTPCWCAECANRRRRTSQAVRDAAACASESVWDNARRGIGSSSGSAASVPPSTKTYKQHPPPQLPHIFPIPVYPNP
jgi:hypothetical protein